MERLFHAGNEHPATLWIAVSAVVSFAFGIAVGTFGTGTFGTSTFGTSTFGTSTFGTSVFGTDTDTGTEGDEK